MSASADRGFEFAGTARFEVVRCLGAGGMGVVYEAYDRERQARVALKTLRSMSADGLLRFKKEFRDFLDLSHPNLISLGELFSEGRDWFFTMELVEGTSFSDWVRPAGATPGRRPGGSSGRVPSFARLSIDGTGDGTGDGDGKTVAEFTPRIHDAATGPLDLDRLRSALAQLVEGLMALHAAEKVHRDIKPSNVLVSPLGRVVLLDYGLATEMSRQEQLQSTDIVGTVEYMAPEQAAARPVGPPADWYAVGVMLYEALTGEVPFAGPALEVMMNKQRLEPVSPRALQPSTPPDLERLCLDLLRFDPERRPDGHEILRRLGVLPPPGDPRPSRPSLTQTPPFVGRAGELKTLLDAFEESRGQAVMLHVHGESGVGKSALVRRFTETLKTTDGETVVLSGACYERESVPYKAVDGLIDALSRYLVRIDKADAASVLPRQAALLTQVFPVLARVEPFAEAPRGSEVRDPQELRSRLFGALRELFARLADRKKLVLTIDDLQWADADSLALLAEVMRPPEAPALLLVATVRDRSAGGDASGANSIASTALTEVRHLFLSRMPSDEARELAQLLIARAAGRPDIDAGAVALEAGGHPLFIDELIRHSHAGVATSALHLEDALWARISQLEPAARSVLELTALAGGRLLQQTAAQAAALDPASFGKQVGLLRVAHLVRTTGTRATDFIEPYHDRVRAAVLANLGGPRERTQHRRLALALEASKFADPEALALHWREAGERARAAEYAAQAAVKAARALAFDRAAQLYGDCLLLGLSRDGDGRDLRIKRGDALANAGRGAEAAAMYLEAADAAPASEALDLRRRASEQLLRSGHVEEGLAALRTVLGAIGMRMAETPGRALASLVARRMQIRLRGFRFKERTEAQLPAEALTRIDTCSSAALCLSVVDNVRGAEFQARHMLLALGAGEPYRVARALAMEASIISTAGRKVADRVSRLLQTADALATRIGHPHAIGLAALASGVAAFQAGRWAEARERCDAADRVFRERCTGVSWEIVTTQLFRLGALGYLGELRELQRAVPAMIQEAESRGDLYALTNLRIRPYPFACLGAGNPALARQQAELAMLEWPRGNFLAQHYYQMVALANADLYDGDGAGAFRRVREEWKALEGSLFMRVQVIRVEALHLRGRAALAAARAGEEGAAARALAAEMAGRIIREGLPWAVGLARLLQAGLASLTGDEEAAMGRLDEAAGIFDAADMRLHAAAARRRRGLVEEADAFMKAQRVREPRQITAMLAPGFAE